MRALGFLLLSFAIISLAKCGSGSGAGSRQVGGAETAMQVSLSDAPADQVLSFQLTINSIVLTSSTGATAGVLPAAATVEISHLQATAQPLSQVTVPPGTYTGATVSISGVTATYVNLSGQVASANFTGTFNVPVTFSPSLVVGTTPVALNLDLNLASSVVSLTTSAFTPTMTAIASNVPAASQQEEGNGGVHDLTGIITSLSSNSFVLLVSQAATPLTIAVDSNTQFTGVTGFGGLAVGNVVEVNAAFESNNTLLASKVEAEVGILQEAEGVVVSRTAGSGSTPNSFTIAVQNSTATGVLSPGILLTVQADATTTYILPADEASFSGLSFTPAFSSFANLAVGQRVEVRTTSSFSAVVAQIKLNRQTVSGTPNSQTGNQFTLTLPADSAFKLLTGATSIDFILQSNTELKGLSVVVLGTPLHVRGLLLLDTPSGRYKLVASRVAP
jgi:uncharacterized protein DUF5666/uncharacterized protein DUF4382